MPLIPLNHHYAIENPASVYDEEAMTALELAGRTTAKVNETVKAFNELEADTKEAIQFMQANIKETTEQTLTEMVKNGQVTVGLDYDDEKENLFVRAIEGAGQSGARYYPATEFLDIL